MKVNKYFRVQELVPEDVFQKRGWNSIQLMDSRIISSITQIREYSGASMIINDWLMGGRFGGFQYRGFRPPWAKVGVTWSQHKMGRAVDFDLYESGKRMHPDEVRAMIRKMKEDGKLRAVTGMEAGVNWVHIDCRYSRHPDKLMIFRP